MKRMGRQTISVVMSVIILLSCFAGLTFSAGAETSGDYEYLPLNDRTVEITNYTGNDTDIVIPAELDGKKVTEIGSFAFDRCTSLVNVKIPDSVLKIGNYAFMRCSGLTNITLSDSVVELGNAVFCDCTGLTGIEIPCNVSKIGDSPFSGCLNLEEIIVNQDNKNYKSSNGVLFDNDMTSLIYYPTAKKGSYVIPDGVTVIESGAFFNCTELTNISIPDGVKTIGSSAFALCEKLSNVTLPDSVTTIGDHAFNKCSGLTSINIPDGVTEINYGTFYECIRLKNITLPDSVTTIGDWAFADCNSLKSILLPDNVTGIGEYGFYKCYRLKSIVIPSEVKKIGSSAFEDCESLANVTIPDGVTEIGDKAFKNCAAFTSIDVDVSNVNYSSFDGVLFDKDMTTLITCPAGKEGEYVIPDSVTSISQDAFYECYKLTGVTIPDGVTEIPDNAFSECIALKNVVLSNNITKIGSSAFNRCTALSSITLPDSVTELGEYAFSECTSLSELILPNGIVNIGSGAFRHCYELKSVIIPESVETIDGSAFEYCKNLEYIDVEAGNASYVSVDGVLFNKDMTELVAYPGGKAGAYSIPESVTAVKSDAFSGCCNITEVSLGSNISDVDGFFECTKLERINVDEKNDYYSSIDGVLYNKDITVLVSYPAGRGGTYIMPDTLSDFGYSFWRCGEMTEIYIPANAQSLPSFAECKKLQNIIVDDNNPNYTSVDGVLFNKDKTVLILYPQGRGGAYTIPETVLSVDDEAFLFNTTITEIYMPDSITDLSDFYLSYCKSLTKLRIPENVTSIMGIYECHSLKEIVIPKSVTYIYDYALGYHGYDDYLCGFGLNQYTKIDGFTIYGYKDSAAQEYAEENGFKFVMIDDDVCCHENTIVKNASEADCTNDGYTGDVYCADCSEKLSDGEKIPALGHTDKNNDGICDYCKKTMPEVENCECICHKDGFAGFMYKLIKFIWRLFGIKKTCDCGLAHY
ncbi:MAG: leucine-rich repeat domain-containing protein [Oscillospiraceae bacterium]|nr:leucine-rich repeat domain-containing protein [Oscillospiraceae bacterium]